ncbi:unnamed protein product [Choristocarpus tenellus]
MRFASLRNGSAADLVGAKADAFYVYVEPLEVLPWSGVSGSAGSTTAASQMSNDSWCETYVIPRAVSNVLTYCGQEQYVILAVVGDFSKVLFGTIYMVAAAFTGVFVGVSVGELVNWHQREQELEEAKLTAQREVMQAWARVVRREKRNQRVRALIRRTWTQCAGSALAGWRTQKNVQVQQKAMVSAAYQVWSGWVAVRRRQNLALAKVQRSIEVKAMLNGAFREWRAKHQLGMEAAELAVVRATAQYNNASMMALTTPFFGEIGCFSAFMGLVQSNLGDLSTLNAHNVVSSTVVGEGAAGTVSIVTVLKRAHKFSRVGHAIAVAEQCGLMHSDANGQVKVAVKVAKAGSARGQLEEATFLQRLRPHVNVVQLFAFDGKVVNMPMVLEAGDGTVRGYLTERYTQSALSQDLTHHLYQFVRWFREAGMGLVHIHDHGIVHHDMKPANLIVSNDICKVIDLGLATDVGSRSEVGGTTLFMPPEVNQWMEAQGRVRAKYPQMDDVETVWGRSAACPSVDVYSTGMCVLEVLAGKYFENRDITVAIEEALEVSSLELEGRTYEMREILRGSLDPNPTTRWTMTQLCDGLEPLTRAAPPSVGESMAEWLLS